MPRSATVRALGVLTAFAVIAGVAPAGPVAAQPTPPGVEAAPAATVEAAEDLLGDLTFTPPSRTFQGELTVSLATNVAGAEIRYTTDGQLPTAASTRYDGTPLRLTNTTQVRAQPFINGQPAGDPGTAIYIAQSVTTQHDLPVLVIDSYGQGLPAREYYQAGLMLFEPGAGGEVNLAAEPTLATRTGFRLRGQSSSSFDKAPYRLEFWDNEDDDADYPVLGMPEDSDWVLRGPFPDKSLIREALAYDLGTAIGLYAPRYRFVEVYVNGDPGAVDAGDYMGVYMIVETIKNRSHRLDLKRLRGDRPEDRTLPRLTGAYIWKFEWMAAEEPILPCQGSFFTCWNDLELVDPHPVNHLQPEMRQWITDHIQEFHDVLNGPNFTDPQTGYRAYIDVESWIDHMIINELSREIDSYYRSAYFHKDRGEKIKAGPLWDYDNSFGVGGFFQNDQIEGWQWQQSRFPVANNWYPRLMEDPAFVAELRARWAELRRGPLSDAELSARVAALAAPLQNAAQRNFQRWPNLTDPMVSFFFTPTAPTWQGQVDFLLDWMLRRAAWLDSPAGWDIGTTPPPPSSPPPGPSSPPPPTSPPPGPSSPPPGPSTPPPGQGGCTATYTVINEWPGGFQGEVTVTAGTAPINNWTVNWTFTDGQSITQAWGAVVSGSSTVTATNEAWNGALPPGGSATFGFLANWNGVNSVPSLTCSAS